MKLETLRISPYSISLKKGGLRFGFLIAVTDEKGSVSWGDIAPFPTWSRETLEDVREQLDQKQEEISKIHWKAETCFKELVQLNLFPSLTFGLESALLAILSPLPAHSVATSALLMGSPQEIMEQARLRYNEGYNSAKLKVSQLSFEEAASVIHQLKDTFRLRIDVNRAWNTSDSLRFFAQFPLNSFDYVEEPFQNPHDLKRFSHPLAIDESFPNDLSLEELESLPTLKALIYKPTIGGGMLGCLPLKEWTIKKGISLVLSSCFESDLGIAQIASMAHRLSIVEPAGIGTYHWLNDYVCAELLRFSHSVLHVPAKLCCTTHHRGRM